MNRHYSVFVDNEVYFDEKEPVIFRNTIDRSKGILDFREEHDTVCFQLQLSKEDTRLVHDTIMRFHTEEGREKVTIIYDEPDFCLEFFAGVSGYDFEDTNFNVSFKSSAGWVGFNISLSDGLRASLRKEISDYLKSVGTSLEELFGKCPKQDGKVVTYYRKKGFDGSDEIVARSFKAGDGYVFENGSAGSETDAVSGLREFFTNRSIRCHTKEELEHEVRCLRRAYRHAEISVTEECYR